MRIPLSSIVSPPLSESDQPTEQNPQKWAKDIGDFISNIHPNLAGIAVWVPVIQSVVQVLGTILSIWFGYYVGRYAFVKDEQGKGQRQLESFILRLMDEIDEATDLPALRALQKGRFKDRVYDVLPFFRSAEIRDALRSAAKEYSGIEAAILADFKSVTVEDSEGPRLVALDRTTARNALKAPLQKALAIATHGRVKRSLFSRLFRRT